MDIEQLVDILMRVKREDSRISAIVLGIPGVVHDGMITHLPYLPKLQGVNVEKTLAMHLGIKVFIENDINAIAWAERERWQDFCHIFWDKGCIGAAIVLGGKLVRGSHGAAGELEWVCDKNESSYCYLAQSIAIVMSVIDVGDIALSGDEMQSINLDLLSDELSKRIPKERLPRLHKIEQIELYQQGLWKMILEDWEEKI